MLLEYSSERISVDYKGDDYVISYNNSDWNDDSPYLPKADSYMYAEDGEFDEDIAYFSSFNLNYDAEYYKDITEMLGTRKE